MTTDADECSRAEPAVAAGGPAPADELRGGLSIRDFLTDGSLPGLCAELSRGLGLEIQVRDESGRLIASAEGSEPWRIIDAGDAGPVPDGATRVPMVVGGQVVGELVLWPGEPVLSDDARRRIERALHRLASAALEVVNDVLELRHRVKELGVLYRLSSLLASHDTTVEQTLNTVLTAAIDVLDLHAGSIVLFPEDSDGVISSDDELELELKASQNLSHQWVRNPVPLSRDRVFDRAVLAGEVLAIEDLAADPRVLPLEDCRREGVRGFISAAMLFQGRPIGVIRLYSTSPRSFAQDDRRLLRSIADQAATVVRQARLMEVEASERQMQRQIRLASSVQSRMLPRSVPEVPGVRLAGRSAASYELAGDFFDFFEVGGGLGVVIGDVVGKGMAAALMMSAVRASLRAHAQDIEDIDEVVARVNSAMCRDTLDNEFATLWYGVLDPETRRLEYCSAGHEPPLVIRPSATGAVTAEHITPLARGGLVLGIDPSQKYERSVCALDPGDVLVAYTDGMTDARNFDEARYGFDRFRDSICEALTDTPNASPEHLVDHAMWSVNKFTGLRRQADDETLVVIRV